MKRSLISATLPLLACCAFATVRVSTAGEWTPVACPKVDSGAADRFEVVEELSNFEGGLGSWQAMAGSQQAQSAIRLDREGARSGRQALRVDYEFVGRPKLEYVQFGPHREIAKPGLGLGCWVKYAGDPRGLRVRVTDKSGETHQIPLSATRREGWQFAAAPLKSQPRAWGGDGNRRLDYPVRFHSIVCDRPRRGYKGKGSLWIDDVVLVRERKPTTKLTIQVRPKRLGNLYQPGETVQIRASGPGDAIRWEVTDFWRNVLASGKGPGAGAEVALPLTKPGYYECTFELLTEGRTANLCAFRCAALPRPDGGGRNAFVGFCTHFRGSAYPAEAMDLFARYGFGEFRDEISWGSTEPKKGKLALPSYGEKFTQRASALGLRPLLICDYANAGYDKGGFPNSDEAIAGYANYCAFLARTLKGRTDTFEVWNEWSGGCGMRGKPGDHGPEAYAKLLVAAYAAVKAVDPRITVVGIGGDHSAHHFDKIQRMMESGGAKAMDAFSVHSYRYPRSPEESDLVGEIQRVAAMAKRVGAPSRVWVTEIGWPTHLDIRGVDERTQARCLVRTMALLQATGVVDKVHWYDFKDDGHNRDHNEHNFGVVRHQSLNYAPKPAVVAASVFARETRGAQAERLWRDGNTRAVFYRVPGRGRLIVAWQASGKRAGRVTGQDAALRDLMWNPLPARGPLTLTDTPIYVTGADAGIEVD